MKLNKYLNESKVSSIEKEMDKLYTKHMKNIQIVVNKIFKNIVVPFLKKKEWKLFVVNRSWFFDDKNGDSMLVDDYPEDKDFQEIINIFEIEIEGTTDRLGELMPNYKR